MGGLSWWHWLIILAAFILIFGAKKLPDAARGVGRSLRILKSEVSAMQEESKVGKETAPSETDASASVATPAAELSASPAPEVTPTAAPAAQAQPVAQPAAQAVPASQTAPAQAQPAAQAATSAEAAPTASAPAETSQNG